MGQAGPAARYWTPELAVHSFRPVPFPRSRERKSRVSLYSSLAMDGFHG